MNDVSLANVTVLAAVSFGAPLLFGFFPQLPVPSAVVEIVAGIVLGPAVLGWLHIDIPVKVLSVIGLGFLLFLAGLEIELRKLKGRPLRLSLIGFVISLAIAVVLAFALGAVHLVIDPLFIAIVVAGTSLGVVSAVVTQAGVGPTEFGQLVLVSATIAEFVTLLLLSMFFAGSGSSLVDKLVLLGGFALIAVLVAFGLRELPRARNLFAVVDRLKDSSTQIRVRFAILLLAAFGTLAGRFGLEGILGAFVAGVVLRHSFGVATDELFMTKVSAIGYGFFVPAFFITTGLGFDVNALFSGPSTIIRIPVLFAIILAVRVLPATLYRGAVGNRLALAAGLLQATTITVPVVAAGIGLATGEVLPATASAMVAASLLTIMFCPLGALIVLRRVEEA